LRVRGGGSVIGDGTHAVFSVAAAKSIQVTGLEGAVLSTGFASGAGVVDQNCDAATSFATLSGIGTNNKVFLDLATGGGYTPTTPGNWPTVPTQIGQALDELASEAVTPIGGLVQTVSATATGTTVNGSLATVVLGGGDVAGGTGGRTVILTGSGFVANSGSNAQFTASLFLNGSAVSSQTFFVTSGEHGGFSLTWQAALVSGLNSIDLQMSGPGASSGQANDCSLNALVVTV
jgi:hypothetical protein